MVSKPANGGYSGCATAEDIGIPGGQNCRNGEYGTPTPPMVGNNIMWPNSTTDSAQTLPIRLQAMHYPVQRATCRMAMTSVVVSVKAEGW